MNEEEIANQIYQWYQKNKANKRKWSRMPIGKAIKTIVKENKNWKETAKWHPHTF